MAAPRETIVEITRQRATDERGSVDSFRRWIELGFDGELWRKWTRVGRPFVEAGRQSMCERALVAEASEHVVGGQRGEIAERVQSEPVQHIDEVGASECIERKRRQERCTRSERDDDRRCTRGERRCER